MNYFRKKRIIDGFVLVAVILFFILGSKLLDMEWLKIFWGFGNALNRFTVDYLPIDFSEFSKQLDELGKTVLLALAGSATGMILGLMSALAISVKTTPNSAVKILVRIVASVCRNIPEGIWAIILLLGFWFGDFLAYMVMSITSYGFLARVFAETIDEADSNTLEALEAVGASYWQIVMHGVIPETLPSLISWALYSVENNIRSATIVGMLAGGGIGYLIGVYKGYFKFPLMLSAILMVAALVILTDYVTTFIRRRIMS